MSSLLPTLLRCSRGSLLRKALQSSVHQHQGQRTTVSSNNKVPLSWNINTSPIKRMFSTGSTTKYMFPVMSNIQHQQQQKYEQQQHQQHQQQQQQIQQPNFSAVVLLQKRSKTTMARAMRV